MPRRDARRGFGRKSVVGVAAAVVAMAGGLAHAGDDLTTMTNADRTGRGLAALTPATDLQAFAQGRAEEMARAGRLWHSQDLDARIGNWTRLGENIGRGPALAEIHRSFMTSGHHRGNILFAHFSQIGVGVASDGRQLLYVAVVFRQPASRAIPPPTAARPAGPRAATRPGARPRPARRGVPPPAPPATASAPGLPPPAEPPPVEAAAPPAEASSPVPAAPVGRPRRPVFEERWFLAANVSESPVPPRAPSGGLFAPILAALTVGLLGLRGAAQRRRSSQVPAPPATD